MQSRFRLLLLVMASPLIWLAPQGARGAEDAHRAALVVEAARSIGSFKPLCGVSGAPDMRFAGSTAPGRRLPRPQDLSATYRRAGICLVRTHDSAGAADIDRTDGPLAPLQGPGGPMGDHGESQFVMFPDLLADPEDPKSYHFGPTDALVTGIRAIGADVLLRLGRGGGTTAPPPRDLKRYGEIVRHIVMHYNAGWAGGFEHAVKYWEVWNEPDLGQIWWRGSPDEYFQLYEALATAVKAADPGASVGGPTIALVNQAQPYREGFLAYAREQRLPLDFFSWHYYSEANDPYDFVRIARQLRQLLDGSGFTGTLSSLDEWNANEQMIRRPGDAQQAAFLTAARIYMQDAPIDQDAYYRADTHFGADGDAPDKTGQALLALGKMTQTPKRLEARGGDTFGLAIEAGRSDDGKVVQVLIANYEIPPGDRGPRSGPDAFTVPGLFAMAIPPRRSVEYRNNHGYELRINGLEKGRRYVVERYRISATNDFGLIDRSMASGPTVHVGAELAPPAVELLVVRQAQ